MRWRQLQRHMDWKANKNIGAKLAEERAIAASADAVWYARLPEGMAAEGVVSLQRAGREKSPVGTKRFALLHALALYDGMAPIYDNWKGRSKQRQLDLLLKLLSSDPPIPAAGNVYELALQAWLKARDEGAWTPEELIANATKIGNTRDNLLRRLKDSPRRKIDYDVIASLDAGGGIDARPLIDISDELKKLTQRAAATAAPRPPTNSRPAQKE